MRKNILFNIFYVFLFLSLSGCAIETNVSLNPSFWENKHQKVAVANYKPSSATLYHEGPQGLLDIAISDAVTDHFDAYLKKVDLSSYDNLKYRFVEALKHKHISSTAYNNYLTKDEDPKTNTTFAAQTDADTILTVQLIGAGATRHYYGFIPLEAPKAFCSLKGEMIDAKTRQVLWRYTSTAIEPISGEWDQPPNYTHFNSVLVSTIKQSEDNLLDNFIFGNEVDMEN